MKTVNKLLLVLLLPLGAHAQGDSCALAVSTSIEEKCERTESIQGCTDRINNLGVAADPAAAVTPTATEAKQAAPSILDLVNTGDPGNSTITDYLPLLRLLLDNGSLGEDGEKIGFEYSKTFGSGKKRIQTKLSAAFEKPGVYEPIEQAMRAATLDDELSALGDDISAQDNLAIGLSFTVASEKFGRDPRLHQPRLEKLIAAADSGNPAEINARRTLRVFQTERGLDPNEQEVAFCQLIPDDGNSEGLRQAYMALVEAHILANRAAIRGFAAKLRNAGFYDVLELINNQPQIVGSATYRSRTEAAGPNELKLQVSWEVGLKDLNGLRSSETATCGGAGSLECLQEFLGDDKLVSGETRPMRFKFDADYTKIERLSFVLPAPGFSYFAEPVERLSVSAAGGIDVGKGMIAGKRARLDGKLTYEDFSDDPLRQDRGIATVTLTYPILPGFYLSLGAIYATKPEFRGEVDKEIGARAGFTYKILEDK
jgi:hypothetical protein